MYAVKNGRNVGIYETWEETQKQVRGFKGAEFKKVSSKEDGLYYINGGKLQSKYIYAEKTSGKLFDCWEDCKEYITGLSGSKIRKFKNRDDALRWLACDESSIIGIEDDNIDTSLPFIFIDGSYKDGVIGFGVVTLIEGVETVYTGKTDGVMHNISGETSALMFALHLLKKLGIKKANIVYDCKCVCDWITDTIKARKDETKSYANFVKAFIEENDLNLFYYKCKSHSGNILNNRADRCAKQSLIDGKFYPRDMLMNKDLLLQ